jgi:hypothetical protein
MKERRCLVQVALDVADPKQFLKKLIFKALWAQGAPINIYPYLVLLNCEQFNFS